MTKLIIILSFAFTLIGAVLSCAGSKEANEYKVIMIDYLRKDSSTRLVDKEFVVKYWYIYGDENKGEHRLPDYLGVRVKFYERE